MLETLTSQRSEVRTFRLANQKKLETTLAEMGVDVDDVLSSRGYFDDADVSPEAHLEWVFGRSSLVGARTRFSDGTLRILYTALEPRTTELEIAHWLSPVVSTTALYRELQIDFAGMYKDLRQLPHVPDFLTGEEAAGAYAQCLIVAEEAVQAQLDGFLTPSARAVDGTCLPILRRSAVAALRPGGWIRLDYEDTSNTWRSRRL